MTRITLQDYALLVQHRLNLYGAGLNEDADPQGVSIAALNKYLPVPSVPIVVVQPSSIPPAPGLVDQRSEKVIATLHPRLQPIARQFVKDAAEAGIDARLISGTRTAQEQNALFAQGRTVPGKIVTHAQAWQSNHNFKIAFDAGVFVNGIYQDESPLYLKLVPIGKALGLFAGADWSGNTEDDPHYELHPAWAAGMSEGQLLAGLNQRRLASKDYFD